MITTSLGAKKIEGTDNWREIFDAHNDSVTSHEEAIAKQVIKYGTTLTVAAGATQTVNIADMTASHELVRWNFTDGNSAIAENSPPSDCEWTTAAGSFTISNTGSASITCQPVFALPTVLTA